MAGRAEGPAAKALELRPAEADDCELLWRWANDPDVRQASFQSEPIALETHTRWFERKLADPSCTIYIATDGAGEPIGLIRFDLSAEGAKVGVSVAAAHRGKGYATPLIRAGVEAVLGAPDSPAVVNAFVKASNAASIRAFERAGFVRTRELEVDGNPAVLLIFRAGRLD